MVQYGNERPVCYRELKFPSCRDFLAWVELLKGSGLLLREIWHNVGVSAKWWLTQQQNDVHLLCSGLQSDDLRSVRKHLSPSPRWSSARTEELALPPADCSDTQLRSFIMHRLHTFLLMCTQYQTSCTSLYGCRASKTINFLFKERTCTCAKHNAHHAMYLYRCLFILFLLVHK